MPFARQFQVCNPSPYERSDYVEVDLDQLEVPSRLDEQSLRLSRLHEGRDPVETPFQIDEVFGPGCGVRRMSFFSHKTPPGSNDYSWGTATFMLEERILPRMSLPPADSRLGIDHYYLHPVADEPIDGFSSLWEPDRHVKGVKLRGDSLEVHFSLVPHSTEAGEPNLCGAATSVDLKGERVGQLPMLSPHSWTPPNRARWGQVAALGFFPLPWEGRDARFIPILQGTHQCTEYSLVWSRCGPIRAIVTLKSEPITIRYNGMPFFAPDTLDVTVCLYRVISLHPFDEFYSEDLYVLTDGGIPISFRAYFSCFLEYEDGVPESRLARFEHIPDYFAVWKRWGQTQFGYGFAADSHARGVECDGNKLWWRLQLAPAHSCVHCFMFHSDQYDGELNELYAIGHCGWYERIFKQLQVLPFTKYASRLPAAQTVTV